MWLFLLGALCCVWLCDVVFGLCVACLFFGVCLLRFVFCLFLICWTSFCVLCVFLAALSCVIFAFTQFCWSFVALAVFVMV